MKGSTLPLAGVATFLALGLLVLAIDTWNFRTIALLLGVCLGGGAFGMVTVRTHQSIGQLKARQQLLRKEVAHVTKRLGQVSGELSKARTSIGRAALGAGSALLKDKSSSVPRVLFVSSNGAGLGHLTRLLAIAKQMTVDHHFFTLSTAYAKLGLPSEQVTYFPSADTLQMPPPAWNRLFTPRFGDFLTECDPDVVVFDGAYVYDGITESCFSAGKRLVWVQRGMWKPEVDRTSGQRHNAARVCDVVVVPGDVAGEEAVDPGSNVDLHNVGPICLVEREDLVEREAALSHLGLRADKNYVLVQLGAGVINEISDLRNQAIQAVRELGASWRPVILRNPLSSEDVDDGAVSLQAYPIASYFNAFEFAVVAGGYNSVQEVVSLQMPSVIVPNMDTKTDDQAARVARVVESGWALGARDGASLRSAIRRLGQTEYRLQLVNRLESVPKADGASQVAVIVRRELELAERLRSGL